MARKAKDSSTNRSNLKEKLEYLNLDLDNLPEFITKYSPIDFRVQNGVRDTEQVVYRYVPINKIQILLTPKPRGEELRVKYAESLPLYRYAQMQEDDDVERYTTFLNMLNTMDISGIEEVEKSQKALEKAIPFRVRYQNNFLWNIYYSQVNDTYFMLVPIEDMQYNNMFYLLKKQIELANSKKRVSQKIYVPINHIDYSMEIFTISEIKDIENYLWLLTGEWVNIYEVVDKKNTTSIHIIGETKVFDDIKTEYKVKLEDREEALDFYKLLKALFILKTELNQFYKFDVRIDKDSKLEFYYNSEKLTLETLPTFIKREYKKASDELVRKNLSCNQLEQLLKTMKKDCAKKEREFLDKERQISTYLEYKKTFIGKIKIFFSSTKKKKTKEEQADSQSKETTQNNLENSQNDVLEQIIQTKPNYTIEDLVVIYSVYDKKQKQVKDLEMDLDALELRLKNLEKKIENATLYIKEIENHKKSIFEFWKFANKDEAPALAEGETHTTKKKLAKVFNYEFDFEELGNKMDKLQRDTLTKEEINSIFLAKTNVLEGINILRKPELDNADEKELKKLLTTLKSELEKEEVGEEDFDIFGSMLEDRTQVKTIANKHHREIEKNKLQLLNISKNTTIEEFQDILKELNKNIITGISKIKFTYNMPVYKVMPDEEPITNLNVCSINSVSSIKDSDKKEITLYKIHMNEGQNAVFYTNIMFFDNTNKTLPIGMNLSDDVIIDIENTDLKLIEKRTFLTNYYSENEPDAAKLNVKTVNVLEFKY